MMAAAEEDEAAKIEVGLKDESGEDIVMKLKRTVGGVADVSE